MAHNHNQNNHSAKATGACCRNHRHMEKKFKSRRGEYIGAIIFNLLFLWIVNKVPGWHIGFIKDNFVVALWAINVNIFVQIGANGLMLAFETPAIRRFSLIISEAASFITMLILYIIYPFDFHNFHGMYWMDWLLPVIFIFGMGVSAIKVLANIWKLLFWR